MNVVSMDGPNIVLFVCVKNSNRSQMAEAFACMHSAGKVEAYGAGSRPSGKVNLKAVESMRQVGYDLSLHESKLLLEHLARFVCCRRGLTPHIIWTARKTHK